MSQYSVCPDPSYFSDDSWPMREDPAGYDVTDIDEPWENGAEWADAELPAPSMEDERRALLLSAELARRAELTQPEPVYEAEVPRRIVCNRQQAVFEFEYLEVA